MKFLRAIGSLMKTASRPKKSSHADGRRSLSPLFLSRKKTNARQGVLILDEGKKISTEDQVYDPNPLINELRKEINRWRDVSDSSLWQVTPETARLLKHWRHHDFHSFRPFFCQLEAMETVIWLCEVAPQKGKSGKRFLNRLTNANNQANPELWQKENLKIPPCFIIVCQNTAVSKLIYDYISGFYRENEDGSSSLENGRLPLFRNYDENGNPLARLRTLLIDSVQLESGEALDRDFRKMHVWP